MGWKNFLFACYCASNSRVYSRTQEGSIKDSWALHIFIICMLRLSTYQLCTSYSNMFFLTRNGQIVKKGVDFKQIDQEWNCV